jgi:hypothetical protein
MATRTGSRPGELQTTRVALDSTLLFPATLVFTDTKQFGNNWGVHPFASAVLVGLLEVSEVP